MLLLESLKNPPEKEKYDKNKLTLPERVCKVLEGITYYDEIYLEDFIAQVYKFCHIANSSCENPHEDWLEEFEEIEKQVVWDYYTSPKYQSEHQEERP